MAFGPKLCACCGSPDGMPVTSFLSPPTVSDAEKPLRRVVALAYRTARQAGRSHHAALEEAETAYLAAHPEAAADRREMSGRVNVMIASAINVDPGWFWRGVKG
jgi:hypothetical protein